MSNKRAHSDGRALQGGLPGKVGAPQGARRSPGIFAAQTAAIHAPDQQTKLRARLKAAEETLRAIQSGEVDALMVSGRRGEQVVSLKGGEPSYRMLVEAMSEGAATLSRNGAVLYCNRRFAELMSSAARENDRNCGAVAGCGNRARQIRNSACRCSEGGCERRIQPASYQMEV